MTLYKSYKNLRISKLQNQRQNCLSFLGLLTIQTLIFPKEELALLNKGLKYTLAINRKIWLKYWH